MPYIDPRTHSSIKEFKPITGLDLNSSELTRDSTASTSNQNCILRQSKALNKRPGFTNKKANSGGYGMAVFHNVSLTTGVITEEVLVVDTSVTKLTEANLTIVYNGTQAATYSLFSDGTQLNFYLYLDGVAALTSALGVGTGGTDITITGLVAAINAITDFVATGTSTIPAAYLDVADGIVLSTTVVNLVYQTWTALTKPTNYVNPVTPAQTAPFYTYDATKTSADFENVSIAEVNDVIYFATGFDELHKYDGTRLYRAGMPDGVTATTSVIAGAARANGLCNYKITYSYTDAKSNVVEGAISPVVAITIANEDSVGLIYYNLRHTYTGAGPAGVSATLFPNANYKGFDTQSSNLVVNIWRTLTGAAATTTYYLVTSATNDPASDTTTYTDSKTDAQLGAAYVPPLKTPHLPPKCKYLDVWRNMLIMSGNPVAVNTVYYADAEGGNEVFPLVNAFDMDSKITGMRSLENTLGVFRERAIDGITGDLATDSIQVNHLSRDGIGCAAHATIQEIYGSLYFLGNRGIYRISSSGGLEEVSVNISPKFQLGNNFNFKQATAVNWNEKFVYSVHMPYCPVNASYSSNDGSETLVFDYKNQAWFIWVNFNLMGGTCELGDGTLYKVDRLVGGNTIQKIKNTLSKYDFSDHEAAIALEYYGQWDSVGEPSRFKKFLRIKIHSYDITNNDFENDTFTLNLLTQHDYLNQDVTDLDLDFSSGSGGWGDEAWGEFSWGETRLSQVRTKIASKKSKSMRVVFKNSVLHESILISGWEVETSIAYGPDPIVA